MSALVNPPLSEILRKEFQDEDYRYAYDEEFANARMATQIKVLRERPERSLIQVELAQQAGMKQSRISELENVNYNSWSVSTLRRLAKALGVRFFFGFESWGELLPEVDSFNRESLERPSFADDPAFKDEPAETKEESTPSLARVSALARAQQPRSSAVEFEDLLAKREQPPATSQIRSGIAGIGKDAYADIVSRASQSRRTIAA